MKVLKFGGTSVGSVKAIQQVFNIAQQQVKENKLIIVVSAMGGTTDVLLNAGNYAATGDETYKDLIKQVELRHLETVKELVPVQTQSSTLSLIKKLSNEIEDLCNGIFLLGELSNRTKDKLVSYGELMSSQMMAASFNAHGLSTAWKDSRELIKTNSNFTNAQVNFETTNQNIQTYFSANTASVVLLPGFISSDNQNVNTT
nr:bifunctional aspartate kinase/homoserine dehydrogenase I [Chitinophagaceae bacterium]